MNVNIYIIKKKKRTKTLTNKAIPRQMDMQRQEIRYYLLVKNLVRGARRL